MGWRESKGLTKTTWTVVRSQRPLWALVVRGALLAGVVGLVFAVPGLIGLAAENKVLTIGGAVVFVVGAWLATSIWMFHAGALVHAADEALRSGTSPAAGEALRAIRPRRRPLSGWAAITVAVGWLLALLRGDGDGGVTAIVRVMLEGLGPVDAIKRSGRLLRDRWGTRVAGNVRLGGLVLLLSLVPGLLLFVFGIGLLGAGAGGSEVAGGVLLAIGIGFFVVGAILVAALRAVFGVALYRYAGSGEAVGTYTAAQLGGAVRAGARA